MADFYGLRVGAWRRFIADVTTGKESVRLLCWSQAAKRIRTMKSPSVLSFTASFLEGEPLLRQEELALFDPEVIPDFQDPRLARPLRSLLLGTCEYTFSTREPRLSATLGISIPEAQLFQNEADQRQWQLLVDTWVYPTSGPPAELWFLADADAYCGIASPERVRELLRQDAGTDLFRRVAAYYCGEGGEFAALVAFLRFAALEGVWVYSNDLRT